MPTPVVCLLPLATWFVVLPGDNPENDAQRIAELLRLGAHALAGGAEPAADGDADMAQQGMASEDIEQVRGLGGQAPCLYTLE